MVPDKVHLQNIPKYSYDHIEIWECGNIGTSYHSIYQNCPPTKCNFYYNCSLPSYGNYLLLMKTPILVIRFSLFILKSQYLLLFN